MIVVKFVAKYFWMAAFFGWAAIILILAVIPYSANVGENMKETSFRWDYVQHLGSFAVFALLYGLWQKQKNLWWLIIAGSIYALSTEAVQLFIESRSFNPVDMIMNVGGLFVGGVVVYVWGMQGREK